MGIKMPTLHLCPLSATGGEGEGEVASRGNDTVLETRTSHPVA
jgi:hypothetical protein